MGQSCYSSSIYVCVCVCVCARACAHTHVCVWVGVGARTGGGCACSWMNRSICMLEMVCESAVAVVAAAEPLSPSGM